MRRNSSTLLRTNCSPCPLFHLPCFLAIFHFTFPNSPLDVIFFFFFFIFSFFYYFYYFYYLFYFLHLGTVVCDVCCGNLIISYLLFANVAIVAITITILLLQLLLLWRRNIHKKERLGQRFQIRQKSIDTHIAKVPPSTLKQLTRDQNRLIATLTKNNNNNNNTKNNKNTKN